MCSGDFFEDVFDCGRPDERFERFIRGVDVIHDRLFKLVHTGEAAPLAFVRSFGANRNRSVATSSHPCSFCGAVKRNTDRDPATSVRADSTFSLEAYSE